MQVLIVILVVAGTFGLCFLLDKGYTKLFRGKAQHRSGLEVRANRRYAVVGLLLLLLGIAGVFSGVSNGPLLIVGGVIAMLAAAALIAYYLTFGVFYDEDSFLYTAFGKKGVTYRFGDIRFQQLYLVQGGNVIVELHMADGNAIALQSAMEGTYPFLDHAFAAWCRQTGRDPASCGFHDPAQSLWFPTEEG